MRTAQLALALTLVGSAPVASASARWFRCADSAGNHAALVTGFSAATLASAKVTLEGSETAFNNRDDLPYDEAVARLKGPGWTGFFAVTSATALDLREAKGRLFIMKDRQLLAEMNCEEGSEPPP